MNPYRLPKATLLLLSVVYFYSCSAAPAVDESVDQPIEVTADSIYTVGREEGESWEMFARARAAAFDAVDNLYVLDTRSYQVVVFDSMGHYVRHFGTRGEGPGELASPTNIFVMPDGRIAVSDNRHRAFVVFDNTGQHIANVTHSTVLDPGVGASHPDGRAGAYALTNATRGSGGLTADVIHLQLEESPFSKSLHSLRLAERLTFKTDLGTVIRDPLWAPEAMIAVLPDGRVAVHHDAEYTLLLIDSTGRVDTVNRPIPAKVVTEEDKQRWKVADDKRRADAGISTPLPYEMPFAERMAVISGLLPDPKRGVWVQRRRSDGEDAGPIDVLGTRGEYLGTLPDQTMPSALSPSGRAAYIVQDSLGVQRVTVKRLLLHSIDR